ncbi:MAG: hypothetical protein NVS3B24_09840 [Candidatus Dormibacteria bacterium]
MGWGLVVIAGLLLLVQLLPGKGPPRGVAPGPLRPISSPPPAIPGGVLTYPTVNPMKAVDLVLFARAPASVDTAAPSTLYAQYWEPGRAQPVVLGGVTDLASGSVSQSPDGHMVRARDIVFRDGANPQDLGKLVDGPGLGGYAWREDSKGLCALQPGENYDGFLVEISLDGPGAQGRRWPLPPALRIGGQVGPVILSCTPGRHALVGETLLDGSVATFDLDMGTGKFSPRAAFGPGAADGLVGSPDGMTMALNNGSDERRRTAGAHSVVRELAGGRLLLDLGTDRRVLAFSGDGAEVLVAPIARAGAQLVRLSDGRAVWTEKEDRVPLGWLARPRSGEFMVAMGRRDLNTCTKGEPGKFPEFCRFEPLQELLRVDGGGNVTHQLGAAVGAWEYALR